jgi:hypothetical protein
MNAASWPFGSSVVPVHRVLPRAVTSIALALLVYLPLEAWFLAGLPPALYWFVRLLPDAIIVTCAIVVVALGDPRARSIPVRILWAVAAVAILVVAANTVRGLPIEDSLNAIRVLTRYLVLGLLVWWAADRRAGIGAIVVAAVMLGGAIQLLVATAQVASRLATSGGDATTLLFLDGTFGRYDRFGLFMVAVIVAIVATSDRIRLWRLAFIGACALLLYLSTSRQAMVGLGVGCTLLVIWPHLERPRRMLALATAMLAVFLLLTSPSGWAPPAFKPEPGSAGAEGGGVRGPSRPIKDAVQLTTDPNRNFRLFYNLELAPWAAATEPLLGFGPRQQVAERPDPRLVARVEAAGMDWQWARNFTNDSNYASMILQFGAIAPALFLLLLTSVIAAVARSAWRRPDPTARFAVAFAGATMVTAFFGPAFEIRTVSIILWVSLMAALAATRHRVEPVPATAGVETPSGVPSD